MEMTGDRFGPPVLFPGTPAEPVEQFEVAEASEPVAVAAVASVNQPSAAPTPKMTAVGIGGGITGAFVAWVRARFDLEITVEDVAFFLPILTFALGYFTKDRAVVQEQMKQLLR